MIRLTRAPDLMLGQHWANLLEQAGIACRLTGMHLQGAAGDIPVDQCGPDLWIENPQDRDRAKRIIEDGIDPSFAERSHWQCETCGEWLEPQFSECWQCGAMRLDDNR